MTLPLWVAIPAGILMLAFIVFAFRQGMKVATGDGSATNNQNDYPPPG